MTTYSYGQLEQLWIKAGGSKSLAPVMAAIALAESGGNPAANNYTDNGGTQTSWGLWQISNGTHSWPGSANPNNALANAKYAVAKYHSQGLSAWGTYDSGAYRQFYKGNVPPSSLPQGGGGSGSGAVLTASSKTSSGNWLASGINSITASVVPAPVTGLLHDVSIVLDRFFGMFGKGQGWRIVFTLTFAGAGFGSFKAFQSSVNDEEGGMGSYPLAILLLGIAAVAAFMAFRPWPESGGKPILPGAYVVDIIEGNAPKAGPQPNHTQQVNDIQAGLTALIAFWIAAKVARVISSFTSATGGGGPILPPENPGGGGGEPAPAPPPEPVPMPEVPVPELPAVL